MGSPTRIIVQYTTLKFKYSIQTYEEYLYNVVFLDLPTCQGAVCPLEGARGSAAALRVIPALLALALLAAVAH